MEFKLHAPFKPTGDQPEAIEKLAQGVKMGLDEQVLLGVTGSGKTFTMASVIEKVQRPTLVLAHNKTLAAQLCAEFKEFFPENAVEYFVSYYDYYQPEAYIPHTDTYIAKDASTNEEIDRLRLSATCALLERRDVIVVSSVSCIYGLGEPEDFEKLMISLRPGMTMERDFLLKRLIEIRYERNDVAFERNRFRVRGDTVELYPAYYRDKAVRVEFFGDEIDRISEFNPVNGQVTRTLQHIAIYPASHYVTTKDKLERAIVEIDKELDEREAQFLAEGKAVEAQRIRQRTRFQVEVDSGKLIEHVIEAVDGMLAVRPPQVTSERASLGIDDAGVSAEGTGTSVVSVSGKVKYDLPDPIAELQDAVGLTRGTIKAILEGCSRLDEFEIDPATFLAQVGDKINRVKNDLIAQGIKYVRLPEDEWYTMRDLELDDYTAYLGQNAWKPDMTSKSLYNYVVYDSAGVERSFAEALDKQEEVLVFAKLPSAFKIDTPLGSYNPDWAYVEEADGERRVYFVTETKGGKNGEPALRDAEKIKIGCAKKHFEALDLGNDFHYNVRTTYQYEAVKA